MRERTRQGCRPRRRPAPSRPPQAAPAAEGRRRPETPHAARNAAAHGRAALRPEAWMPEAVLPALASPVDFLLTCSRTPLAPRLRPPKGRKTYAPANRTPRRALLYTGSSRAQIRLSHQRKTAHKRTNTTPERHAPRALTASLSPLYALRYVSLQCLKSEHFCNSLSRRHNHLFRLHLRTRLTSDRARPYNCRRADNNGNRFLSSRAARPRNSERGGFHPHEAAALLISPH